MRTAAQSLASLLLTTQTHALNSDIGAAIWISRDGIFNADIPTQDDLVKGVNEVMNINGVAINPVDLIGRDEVRLRLSAAPPQHIYRARFLAPPGDVAIPPSPWFGTRNPGNDTIDIHFRDSQQLTNTIWPGSFYVDPKNPNCSVEFHQHPIRSSLAEEWPKLATIDVRYSGFGNKVFREELTLAPSFTPTDISLLFTRTGQPTALVVFDRSDSAPSNWRVEDIPIRGTLYLLVAYAEDVASGVNTLANEDSVWIRMESETGHVTMAWNNPITPVSTPPSATQLETARQNVREGKGLTR